MATTIERENEPKPARNTTPGASPKAPQDGPISIADRIARASLTRRSPGGGEMRREGLGAWRGYCDRLKTLAEQSNASMGFLLAAMQGHFAELTIEQKREAVGRTFGGDPGRSSTAWGWSDVAAGIRAEADLLCISTSRLIAAMVLAWEVLDEASRTAAIEAELRREIDRRAAMRGEAAKGGGA